MPKLTESFEFDILGRRSTHRQEGRKDIENAVVKSAFLWQSLFKDLHAPQKHCKVNEKGGHNVVVR